MLKRYAKAARKYARNQLNSLHLRLALVQLLVRCIPYDTLNGLRTALYRWAFPNISKKVYITGRLDLYGDGDIYPRLSMGAGTTINTPCFIELSASVTLGKEVALGNHIVIITSSHEIGPTWRRALTIKREPVQIGDGAWIGACATIASGVNVGPGSFVTAGSIVTKDVPANAQVAGNPARVIGWLDAPKQTTSSTAT